MLKTGVIGLGFIGPVHIEALRRNGLADIVAVADRNVSVAEVCAEKYNIPRVYADYRDLLADAEIEIIHICAPNFLHYEIAKAALEAGKHVICEKPLAILEEEAKELVDLAKRKQRVGVTSFNLRFYPLVQQAKSMIQNGKLGKLYAYHGSYLQDWLLYDTDYSWRLDSKVSGKSRAIADIGSHWIDMAEYVTGGRIVSLCADVTTFLPVRKKPIQQVQTFQVAKNMEYEDVKIDTEDFATLFFHMDDGVRGSLTVSQVSAGRKNRLQFEADGAENSLAWDSEQPNSLWIVHRNSYNEQLIKDPNLMDADAGVYAAFPGGHTEGFPDTLKQLFRLVYEYIFREGHLSGENPSFPTFEDGLREIRICDAILKSSEEKAWVNV